MLTPVSTYRIQLHEKFTFHDLDTILGYLHDLGISTIYAAPITTAVKGSNHGYDVIDPLHLNPDIGTEEQLANLATRLKNYGMTWLQDIVPNHMAYDTSNPWLYDLLERGPQSPYFQFFDIVTDHPVELLGDKLMAPFLGAPLTECLQKGEISLQFTDAGDKGFVIRYYDTDYPVVIRLYRWICTVADGYPAGLSTSLDALEKALPTNLETWKTAKTQWLQQMNSYLAWPDFVAGRLQFFNQRVHLLESLLQSQYYLLTHHRLSSTHINYRRFFTVNSLISLRMEDPLVFREYHPTIHRWYTNGWINGLRIDHIDGLANPKQYLQTLKGLFGQDCYIVAEKILTGEEQMPADWPIEGSTGYDFLAAAGQLLTDAAGSRELLDFYRRQIVDLPPYPTLVYERKLDYLQRYMRGELDNLMDQLTSLPSLPPGRPHPSLMGACPASAATQDKNRLREALATWMAAFPVYRAYPDATGGSPEDPTHYSIAIIQARQRRPDLLTELNFLDTIVSGADATEQHLSFLSRLMQFTSPLAAKGIEDTSFYVYNPYIAHCEVGDSPSLAGISPNDFHRRMQDRRQKQRYSLNATTTHDTKRGEDSRIRLSVLSAIPQEWITAVTRWRELNRPYVAPVAPLPSDHRRHPDFVAPSDSRTPDFRPAPSPNDEYLIYQALLGGFPADGVITDIFRERFSGYLTKALREAKTETNYDDPDEAYEKQCQTFATALLQPDSSFLREFAPFAQTVIRHATVYSLSLLLLKLTAPGIPDIYQGAELWEESFVDPDNRRLVDFTLRTTLLHDLKKAAAQDLPTLFDFLHQHRVRGVEKLYTVYRTLEYRNTQPELFSQGAYIPLACEGPWLAYLRQHQHHWALVAVPLIRKGVTTPTPLSLTLPPDAPSTWTNRFTGATIESANATIDPAGATIDSANAGFVLRWPDHFPGATPVNATPWPLILLSADSSQ